MKKYKYPAVLTIAGSDSGGGAGIQADLKTFAALGCFGTSAITAITVQNTRGVTGIHSVPAAIVQGQIKAVMDDIKPAAIKIGMVHSAELVKAIATVLRNYTVPVVLDPVMVATSGDKLIEDDTIEQFKQELFPLAEVVTPNLDEAQLLSNTQIQNLEEMKNAGRLILQTGCESVLVKGGHLQGPRLYDVYLHQHGNMRVFESAAIESHNTHGTGCTLSSAIAAYIALGMAPAEAIENAKLYVHHAIDHGKDVVTGEGHGPLNHFFDPIKQQKHELE
ncbi:bifunctional hydroxymethylpyrimidine kinase/phosphomethylpyrimidine kinase [Pontibacter harenae]|uniref:bifunctional hydroxymethylpyrimidine kinase/phosphomethylpyrimidine kinase n=1 Tax=Pontibacter harenae TaxID=2894083 RepID=UPI001E2ADC90|nr:bifunctional hydroxymethylpyrimidine kinase/phosphomethylpyrimidine kinase [Pontibacter harenae]MCC9168612.1 bifunctional hydroxymethylpyrimidine kinase/phosphomethylpyrimidine kinase [Pontibacter harenae]